mgnify:CR=1 FL=1
MKKEYKRRGREPGYMCKAKNERKLHKGGKIGEFVISCFQVDRSSLLDTGLSFSGLLLAASLFGIDLGFAGKLFLGLSLQRVEDVVGIGHEVDR